MLVVYHAPAKLDTLLEALTAAVAPVIVVDNAERAHAALPSLAQRVGFTLLHNGNRGGLAGAYNRALAHLDQQPHEALADVVFLDDDSDPMALAGFLADPQVRQALDDPATAAVAPAYRERATGLRGKYIVLERFGLHYLPRQFDGMRKVAFVINSMSVWPRTALARIGRFDERLAIDHVDTDYCLRARRLGLHLFVHGGHEFAHSIGQRRRYRLFGRELQAGGHDPARRWLIARNTTWLARRWLWHEPAFAFLCITRLAYEAVGIVMAEDHKSAKLGALLRGAAHGLFRRSA